MPKSIEEQPRAPQPVEWLMDIAASAYGMRVESCRQWEAYERSLVPPDRQRQQVPAAIAAGPEIIPKQVEGPTAQAMGNLQSRQAKGEKLVQAPERKMDRMDSTKLEEWEEGTSQQVMSREKRMGRPWSETEQLMREIRKGNGGDEASENVRSNILKLYSDAQEGKQRLNDAINDPGKQQFSDSEAVMSIVAYEVVKDAVTLGGVDKPLLDAMDEDRFVEEVQSMSRCSDEVVYAADFSHDAAFFQQNVLNPQGVKKLSLSVQAAASQRIRQNAAEAHPQQAERVQQKEALQQMGLDRDEEEKNKDGKSLLHPEEEPAAKQVSPVLVLQREAQRESDDIPQKRR